MAMDEWYCRMGTQEYGPMPFQQLFQAASAGQLPADAWVRFGNQEWAPITAMPQLAGFFQRQPVASEGSTHVVRRENSAASSVKPVGVPVASPRVAAVASVPARGNAPAGVAVGRPVAAVQPVIQQPPVGNYPPVVSVVPPPPGNQSAAALLGKKKGNPLLVPLILGGSVLGLVLVAIVVILAGGKSSKKETEMAEESVPRVEELTGPAADPSLTGPTPGLTNAPSPEIQPPDPAVSVASLPGSAIPVATHSHASELGLFKKQTKWRDPRSVKSLSGKSMKLEIVQAWLAVDSQGNRLPTSTDKVLVSEAANVDADAPDATASEESTSPEEQPTSPDEAPVTPQEDVSTPASANPAFVFVQVRVSNPGTGPLTYRSWNGPIADTTAMLATDGSEFASLVPTEQTKDVARKTGSITVAPQENVLDTLVFEAPEEAFTSLHLLLPQAAIPALGPGYIGWELHSDYLAIGPSTAPNSGTPVATGPARPAGGMSNGAQPETIDDLKATLMPSEPPAVMKPAGEGAPADMPAQPDMPAKPAEPPSIQELNRQFEEMEKEVAKPTPDNPAPADPPTEKTVP